MFPDIQLSRYHISSWSSINYRNCLHYQKLQEFLLHSLKIIDLVYFFVYYRQESLLFLILYVFYCIGMAFNSKFESWAIDKMPVPQSWRDAVVQQQQEKPYKTINKVIFRQLAVSQQVTLLFYQIEPLKNGVSLILPSSITRNSSAPNAKRIFVFL